MAKLNAKPSTPAVKEPESNSLVMVQTETPDYIKQDQQRGSEQVGQDDIVIPRLEIVQALSPAVKEGDPGFIEEARPGMLQNSVTKQLYGKEVMVVPVFYNKQWLVWRQRKDKDNKPIEGGFFGSYNSPEEADLRVEEEGGAANYIESIDTPQHLCLLISMQSGTVEEVMVSMPRTKAKISRQWNSMIRLAGGDRFSRVYRIGTQLEKKTQGDYYNFVVAQSGFPAKVLYDRAEKLYEQIAAGSRKVVMDVTDFDKSADSAGSTEGAEM
jgi:hypothetical protein